MIYVASSWRNLLQPAIVTMLRKVGHEVYDFRNPVPGQSGFNWREIDPNWQAWTPAQYREALKHPIALAGFNLDMQALRRCSACLLVLPSGRSASFEFGWAIGAGKKGAVVMFDQCEPELMYLGNPILTTPDELFDWAERLGLTTIQPTTTPMTVRIDDDDARDINAAIANYQATRRWRDEQGGVMLPEGESDLPGAVLGEICRDWMSSCA